MKLSDCGDCPKKSTCLIPDENKTWLHTEPDKETRLVTDVEVLKAFGLEGISEQDHERAKVIAKEIQKN